MAHDPSPEQPVLADAPQDAPDPSQPTLERPAPPPLQLAERGVKFPGLAVEGWVSLADRR